MKNQPVRLPRTIVKKCRKRVLLETLEIQDDGTIIGWCEVLRKLKILQCDGRCSTCYCG